MKLCQNFTTRCLELSTIWQTFSQAFSTLDNTENRNLKPNGFHSPPWVFGVFGFFPGCPALPVCRPAGMPVCPYASSSYGHREETPLFHSWLRLIVYIIIPVPVMSSDRIANITINWTARHTVLQYYTLLPFLHLGDIGIHIVH